MEFHSLARFNAQFILSLAVIVVIFIGLILMYILFFGCLNIVYRIVIILLQC